MGEIKKKFQNKGGNFITKKIGRKLIASFLLISFLVGVIGYVSLYQSEKALQKEIGDHSVTYANQVLREIDNIVENRFEQVDLFAKELSEDSLSYDEDLVHRIRDFKSEKFYKNKYGWSIFNDVVVGDINGNVIFSESSEVIDDVIFEDIKKNGEYVSKIKNEGDDYFIEYGVEVSDIGGNYLGFVKSTINIREIKLVIDEFVEENNVPFKLITNEGFVIYSSEEFENTKLDNETLDFIKEHVGTDYSYLVSGKVTMTGNVIYKERDIKGDKLVIYVDTKDYGISNVIGWAFLEYDTDDVFSSVDNLKNLLLLIFIFLIGLSLSLGMVMSRKISKPIEELNRATLELEKGIFSTRVNIKTGDELEELGNAFNKTTMALGRMHEEHEELDRAKTKFLSVTSHELRSPMTPMRAQLQMLMKDYFGKITPEQKQSLEIVLRNTIRLDGLIVDLLEISRIESARLRFKFARTDLGKVVYLLVKEMQGFMPEKGIKISATVEKMHPIMADADRVSQVLRNLINNAIKFTPKNGRIDVKVKQIGGMILFSVTDNGVGISKQNQAKIFEPFFQVEKTIYREHQGAGLGLAIIRGIVKSQNGKIWLESNSKGSTFYFTLPLKPVEKIEPIKILLSGDKAKGEGF